MKMFEDGVSRNDGSRMSLQRVFERTRYPARVRASVLGKVRSLSSIQWSIHKNVAEFKCLYVLKNCRYFGQCEKDDPTGNVRAASRN